MAGRHVVNRSEADLVSYRRGTSLREIAKGALARFLPGSLITLTGLRAIFDISMPGSVLATTAVLLGFAGALTGGFGLTLLALRRWLYPDAELGGRRSFLAGLGSPLALFAVAAVGPSWILTQLPVLLVLVGMVTALGMFFAWLSPTPKLDRGDGSEPEPLEQVSDLSERAS